MLFCVNYGGKMVSIVIPAYNVEKYISKCLESIINQTFTDLEVLIVDDGSTDGTKRICCNWIKKDSRIRYYEIAHQGQGTARNKGIQESKGEYLVFVDADDWLELNALECMHCAMVRYDADIVYSDATIVVFDEKEQQVCSRYSFRVSVDIDKPCSLETKPELLHRRNGAFWIKMYKKSWLFNELCRQPGHPYEDIATIPLVFLKARKIVRVKERLYNYHAFRSGNTVTNNKNTRYIVMSISEIIADFKAKEVFDHYRIPLMKLIISLAQDVFSKLRDDQSEEAVICRNVIMKIMEDNFCDVYKPRRYVIWGSYNTYKAVTKNIKDMENEIDYYTGSSIISCMSRPVIDGQHMYPGNSPARYKWVKADFEKKFIKRYGNGVNDEILVIDFLEERCNLQKYNESWITLSEYVNDFLENGEVLEVGTDDFISLWEKKAVEFLNFIEKHFRKENIILVRQYLTPWFGEYGKDNMFEQKNILVINKMLEHFYDFFLKYLTGIVVLDVPDKYNYCDTLFQYGCHPHYLNEMAYYEMADEILDIVQKNGE